MHSSSFVSFLLIVCAGVYTFPTTPSSLSADYAPASRDSSEAYAPSSDAYSSPSKNVQPPEQPQYIRPAHEKGNNNHGPLHGPIAKDGHIGPIISAPAKVSTTVRYVGSGLDRKIPLAAGAGKDLIAAPEVVGYVRTAEHAIAGAGASANGVAAKGQPNTYV